VVHRVGEAPLVRWHEVRVGDFVELALAADSVVKGQVGSISQDVDLTWRVAGKLVSAAGEFQLAEQGQSLCGLVRLPLQRRAYVLSTDSVGKMVSVEMKLSQVECLAMPGPPAEQLYQASPGYGTATSSTGSVVPPALDSRPSAEAVVYLDFDGGLIQDPGWNGGHPLDARPAIANNATISVAGITQVWQQVAEDFAPFDLSITTIPARYDAAPVGRRMRVIVTPTNSFMPNAGGVAVLNTFSRTGVGASFSPTVPCWVFTLYGYTTTHIANIASHEIGHTMGLRHDGLSVAPGLGAAEYYDGHGSDATSWGPIMGTPYGKAITQWSKGEYFRASNMEDDLALITSAVNGLSLVSDDVGDDASSATLLPDTGVIDVTGLIGTGQADEDWWLFESSGGAFSLSASPQTVGPNLDLSISLLRSDGVVLQASDPRGLAASMERVLAPGYYLIRVVAAQVGTPMVSPPSGYTRYGSQGSYRLKGKFVFLPDTAPLITAEPPPLMAVAPGVAVTLRVQAKAAATISYQWFRDGVAVPGATGASYSISKAALAHEGEYQCQLTNIRGTTLSERTTLTLNYKPVILQQPLAQSYAWGSTGNVTLTVDARGTFPLSYQWQRNGVNLSNATDPQLTLTGPLAWADGASYRCIVANAFGATASRAAAVTVAHPPILQQDLPSQRTVAHGSSTVLAVTATGTATLRYQWRKDGVVLTGAATSSLSFSRLSPAASGSYSCTVSNDLGQLTSTSCSLSVLYAPALVVHPVSSLTVPSSGAFSLSVVAFGSADLHYRWQKNGQDIPGAADAPLFTATADWWSRGSYCCVVSNAVGRATSKYAAVEVRSAPLLISMPSRVKVARGASLRPLAQATGSGPLRYQWSRAGLPMSGQTQPFLILPPAADSTAGNYVLTVSNAFGSISSQLSVIVENPPRIVSQPRSITAGLTTTSGFSVFAASPAAVPSSEASALRYQWQRNNVNLPSETSAVLILTNLATAHAGSYRCIISNDVGSVTTVSATLTLHTLPSILAQPVPRHTLAYAPTTFRVTGTGTGPLLYRWSKDGLNLNASSRITGTASPELKITETLESDAGTYSCVVFNTVGQVHSTDTALTVEPVAAPTVTALYPAVVRVGQLIRITGTNLNWVTSVSVQAVGRAVTPLAIHRSTPTEVLAVAPNLPGQTLPLLVTTRHSAVSSGTSITIQSGTANDSFANAQVVPPLGGKLTGDTTGLSGEQDEPRHALPAANSFVSEYDPVRSAWFQWQAPSSGYFTFSTAGTRWDTRLAIYSGSTLANLNPLGASDNTVNYSDRTSLLSFYATAGTTYYLALDGFFFSYVTLYGQTIEVKEYGPYTLTVAPRAGSELTR
jgi:hypothetical protein